MIRNSLTNPLGALSQFRSATGKDGVDLEGVYKVLCTYWAAVREVFPDAWGKDPRESSTPLFSPNCPQKTHPYPKRRGPRCREFSFYVAKKRRFFGVKTH
jgi:hypothetical protein